MSEALERTKTEKTAEQKKIDDMQRTIDGLSREVEILRKITKPQQIVKTKEVPPPDYNDIKKELRKAQQELNKYRKILTYGNVSTLETLIDDYLALSKTHLKRIVKEINLADGTSAEIRDTLQLIAFFDTMRTQLYDFVAIHDEGRMLLNPSLRACQADIERILSILGRKGVEFHIRDDDFDQFHELLLNFIDQLNLFVVQPEEES